MKAIVKSTKYIYLYLPDRWALARACACDWAVNRACVSLARCKGDVETVGRGEGSLLCIVGTPVVTSAKLYRAVGDVCLSVADGIKP